MNLVENLRDVLQWYEPTLPSKEQFQAWVNALRSGDYFQTYGALWYKGEYCCIGVYGEAVCGVDYTQFEEDGLSTTFLKGVEEEASVNFFVEFGGAFAEANDSDEYTFEDIAKAIEEVFL